MEASLIGRHYLPAEAVKSLDSGVSEARTEFFFKLFIYLWLCWSSLLCTVFLSLAVNVGAHSVVGGVQRCNGEWGLLFIVVRGLHIMVASVAVAPGL